MRLHRLTMRLYWLTMRLYRLTMRLYWLTPFLCEAALNFLSFFVMAVAHGGNPQDRAASPLRPSRFVYYIVLAHLHTELV
ncbi:MAG: hypothetical protein V7L25_10460 [Nostoc sp.]